jgi:hypothetical protein
VIYFLAGKPHEDGYMSAVNSGIEKATASKLA